MYTNLTMLYVDNIMRGKVTNFNKVPKFLQPSVEASLKDYNIYVAEDGSFYYKEQEEAGEVEE